MKTKKVVVLEDDDAIRDLIAYILTEQNIDVIPFSRIAPLKETIDKLDADLYLLDIMLPDGDGAELCYHLKNSEHTRHIPVLLMSAAPYSDDSRCKAEGFVKKPFNIDELMALLQKELQRPTDKTME